MPISSSPGTAASHIRFLRLRVLRTIRIAQHLGGRDADMIPVHPETLGEGRASDCRPGFNRSSEIRQRQCKLFCRLWKEFSSATNAAMQTESV